MDFALRIITLILFAGWQGYWLVTGRKADREKPKKPISTKLGYIRRYIPQYVVYAIILLQVLGWQIFTVNFPSQEIGFFLVVLGIAISVSARITLGTNWAHAAEYQIKQKQVLVTSGIYAYIRNPIYTGLLMAVVGAELVAKSYLFIVIALIGFLAAYKQSKLEEAILEKHFGKAYIEYKKKTKLLIPFVW